MHPFNMVFFVVVVWAWHSVADMKLATRSTFPMVDIVNGAITIVQLLDPVQRTLVRQLG